MYLILQSYISRERGRWCGGKNGSDGERSSGAAHVLAIRVRMSNISEKALAPLNLISHTTTTLLHPHFALRKSPGCRLRTQTAPARCL